MIEHVVVDELIGLVDRLAEVPRVIGDNAVRIDVITALEKVQSAVTAAQLQVIADFDVEQEAANRAKGLRGDRARRGIADEVGLARKVSAASAAKQVTQAKALTCDMPQTFALLRRGEISEWVARNVVNETSHLAAEDRRAVDAQLADELAEMGPMQASAAARRLAIEADPAAAVARASNARKDRRVSVRPAPDTMAILSALVPVEQGAKAYGALHKQANALIAGGDERSRNQIMADELVARLTGQASAEAVSVEIALVMTDTSLLGDDERPAEIPGYGPIPAEIARALARRAGAHLGTDGDSHGDAERARVWVRRLYTDPVTGTVRECDARRRRFDGSLARLLYYRDGGTCRDPFCDAPIREYDHIHPFADGGETTVVNGRGVCQRGNHTRQMPGWNVRVIDPERHIVETTTPTGHTYRSSPPPAPGSRRRRTRTRPPGDRTGHASTS